MLTAGPRAALGLLSPGDRPIERGDPFHGGLRDLGCLNCRAGFVVEDAASCRPWRATTSTDWLAPTSRRSPSGTRRCGSGRPVGALHEVIDRHLGDPFFGIFLNRSPDRLDEWVIRRSGRGRPSSSDRVWRSRSTSSRRPGRRISPPTSRTASVCRTSCAASWPPRIPMRGADPAPAIVHGRCARHRAPSGRSAVLEHPRLPATVLAPTRRAMTMPSDERGGPRRSDRPRGRRCDPDSRCGAGARLASLLVDGHELLVTEGDGPIGGAATRWSRSPVAPRRRFPFRDRLYDVPLSLPRTPSTGPPGPAVGGNRPIRRGLELTTDLGPDWPFRGRWSRRSCCCPADGGDLRSSGRTDARSSSVASLVPALRRWGECPARRSRRIDVPPGPDGLPTGSIGAPTPGPGDDAFADLVTPPRLTCRVLELDVRSTAPFGSSSTSGTTHSAGATDGTTGRVQPRLGGRRGPPIAAPDHPRRSRWRGAGHDPTGRPGAGDQAFEATPFGSGTFTPVTRSCRSLAGVLARSALIISSSRSAHHPGRTRRRRPSGDGSPRRQPEIELVDADADLLGEDRMRRSGPSRGGARRTRRRRSAPPYRAPDAIAHDQPTAARTRSPWNDRAGR